MIPYLKLVKEFNDTNKGESIEVVMRVATIPVDLIFALALRIKYRKVIKNDR